MASTSKQHNETSQPRWISAIKTLALMLNFCFSIFSGVVVSLIAVWLLARRVNISGTPLERILQYLPFFIFGMIGLAILRLVILMLDHYYNFPVDSSSEKEVSLENRKVVINQLLGEYRKQLCQSLQGVGVKSQKDRDLTISSGLLVSRKESEGGYTNSADYLPILQAYDESGGNLLMLGSPGAGKSTLLLELACQLLHRADQKEMEPIPIIVDLSFWAKKKSPFEDWLVDQLAQAYPIHITRRLGKALIAQDRQLLLLDGLDEVKPDALKACVDTINAYRTEHPVHFVHLVVCSRNSNYLLQTQRLKNLTRVEVQPLTLKQVEASLKLTGLDGVHTALQRNTNLGNLVTTPFWLGLVIRTYMGKQMENLPQSGTIEEQQYQIIEQYVEHMLRQERRYGAPKIRKYLIFLAKQMTDRGLKVFYLEDLQSTWLPVKRVASLFPRISGLVGMIVTMVFVAPLDVLLSILSARLFLGFIDGIGDILAWILGIELALFSGLFMGLLVWLESRQIVPIEKFSWPWKKFWQPFIEPTKSQHFGLLCTLVMGLFIGLFIGLFSGSISGLTNVLLFGLTNSLLFGLSIGVVGILCLGLLGGPTKVKLNHIHIEPNQRILASGRNAFRMGLFGGLFGGLCFGLSLGLFFGLFFGPSVGLFSGLLVGLFSGLLIGLMSGLLAGGTAYLNHYILRFLLMCSGVAPWRYVRFLNEASERALLQRIGAGYSFIRPIFQEHFATPKSVRDSKKEDFTDGTRSGTS